MGDINYDIMRYELDENGYIYNVYFGCASGYCTGYTGEIPSGYSSLEEWNEKANIRAYKIIDGNLIYDAEKDSILTQLCKTEDMYYRHVTHGEVEGMLNNLDIEVSNESELEGILPINTEEGEVVYIEDSSSYPVERITVTSKGTMDAFNLYISTSNMLPVDVLDGNKNGIIYTVNEDKSISLLGTTEDFTLDISGNATNTEPLFIFKAGKTYYINETSGITLSLYTNDGTERTLYYTGTGATSITPEEDMAITHVEISCTGKVDTTVELMVSVGASKEYEPCECTIIPIDLNGHTAQLNDLIEIEDGIIILNDGGINLIDMPCTYYEKTTMYTDKGTFLEVDYKKSGFDTVTKSGKGSLTLRNTADGYGSIFSFLIEDLEGGATYILKSSDGDEQTEQYVINLSEYTGTVDVTIEQGRAAVWQDGSNVGELAHIYIRTYSPKTYIELVGCTNRLTCEYMVGSDFSVYCTRVEKEASIKMLDDKISLEVKRASAVEGELEGKIEIEADKIEQIVTSVGTDGEVTAASIVLAINEDDESEVKISAGKVDVNGLVFPTIQNATGECKITTLFNNAFGDGIEYNSPAMHVFNGSLIINPSMNLYGLQVKSTTGEEMLRTGDTFVSVGNTDKEVRLYGKVLVNGVELGTGGGNSGGGGGGVSGDYYTKAEIDAMIGDVETVLNTLNSGGGVA